MTGSTALAPPPGVVTLALFPTSAVTLTRAQLPCQLTEAHLREWTDVTLATHVCNVMASCWKQTCDFLIRDTQQNLAGKEFSRLNVLAFPHVSAEPKAISQSQTQKVS
jgi:hypothetical protein